MTQKIINILNIGLFITFIFAFPIEILYLSYNKTQLTPKSFNSLYYLNNEISKLSVLEGREFKDKEELIFELNKLIAPNIFNEYYFLKEYLYTYKIKNRYYPKIDYIEKQKVEGRDIGIILTQKYFNEDSLISKIKLLVKPDIFFNKYNYLDYEAYPYYTINNVSQLVISNDIINKLETIKNIPYSTKEEFEYALKETIGLEDYKQYSSFIDGIKDSKAMWQKYILYFYVVVFSLFVILRIVFAIIVNRNKEKKVEKDIEDSIDSAREEISKNPEKILPVWDLANNTLQKYYNKNLSQINSIYRLSIVVMVMGFALIVSILIATIYFKIDVKLDSIGIIAGIITEFIGATFLFIYKSTVNQALQHSKSLEKINNVGMSIKIVESIEKSDINKEKLDDAKIEIAKRLITTSSVIKE